MLLYLLLILILLETLHMGIQANVPRQKSCVTHYDPSIGNICCIAQICEKGEQPVFCKKYGDRANCEPCSEGKFSHNRVDTSIGYQCEHHRNCDKYGKKLKTKGNATTNSVCMCDESLGFKINDAITITRDDPECTLSSKLVNNGTAITLKITQKSSTRKATTSKQPITEYLGGNPVSDTVSYSNPPLTSEKPTDSLKLEIVLVVIILAVVLFLIILVVCFIVKKPRDRKKNNSDNKKKSEEHGLIPDNDACSISTDTSSTTMNKDGNPPAQYIINQPKFVQIGTDNKINTNNPDSECENCEIVRTEY